MKKFGKILYSKPRFFKFTYHYLSFYYYFFKRPRIPSHIYIESTNTCNYKCIMCPMQTMKRKVGLMDFNLYKQIIDEASKLGIPNVRPQFYGEPLLHPEIVKMIKYAKDKNLNVGFDTNVLLLNKDLGKKIINAGIDWIIFSFHGFTPAEYKSIHERDSFNRVIENIKTFYKIKKESNSNNPKIIIQTAIMDKNFRNVHKIFSIFNGMADEFRITNCNYHPQTMKEDCRLIKFNYRRNVPCSSLFTILAVSWDGKVTVCCRDHNFKLKIGNIDEGMLNLFNSEKLNHYRRLHLLGKYEKIPLCLKCLDNTTQESYIPVGLRNKIIDRT